MKATSVIIADDHAVFRTGLAGIVNDIPNCKVIAETGSGTELVQLVKDLQPDLLITDDRMFDISGADALFQLKLEHCLPPAIVMSSFAEMENAERCILAGALSYIEKIASIEILNRAIHSVLEGRPYFPDVQHMKLYITVQNHPNRYLSTTAIFTQKEIEVIRLIIQECSNAAIADQLAMSVKTVESYRQRIYQKAGVKTVVGLSTFVHKHFASL